MKFKELLKSIVRENPSIVSYPRYYVKSLIGDNDKRLHFVKVKSVDETYLTLDCIDVIEEEYCNVVRHEKNLRRRLNELQNYDRITLDEWNLALKYFEEKE